MSRFALNFIGFLLLTGNLSGIDFKALLQRAERGDVEAQYRLAEMYAEAQGVDQDYAKATQWARKAADQGYAKAQYRLASIIYTGVSPSFVYAKKGNKCTGKNPVES